MRSMLLLFSAAALMFAQNRAPEPVSPEIHPDRTVTFRLAAPEAKEVVLRILMDNWESRKQPMTKDEAGVWSVTLGPFEPVLTDYSFILDGVQIIDPRNPLKKQGLRGAGSSQLVIPADPPAVWEMRAVPHGSVHVHWYTSPAWDVTRRFHVYTPPGYEAGRSRYPVLYLLHGAGDTDREWIETGKANFILDNLIAERKARPMIIVMPDGHGPQTAAGRASAFEARRQAVLFEKDIVTGVIPEVEKLYRVERGPEFRAIAGLSMGGRQTLQIGLNHLDLFSAIGVFSMGLTGERGEKDFEADHERVLVSAEETNRKLRLFWVGCGEKDFLWSAAQTLDKVLSRYEIKHTFRKTDGGHVWMNWAKYLAEFAPQLFH